MTAKPPDGPVTVRTCGDAGEAALIRSMLEADGIQVLIPDENMARMEFPLMLGTAGIRVQVAPDDVERALELLERDASDL